MSEVENESQDDVQPTKPKPKLRYAIVGSREYPQLDKVTEFVHLFFDHVHGSPYTGVIVSGGARGVDRVAETAAKYLGLETLIFEADWTTYGRAAGMIRNKDIVDNADVVVAFWDGVSPGTLNSINYAIKQKKNMLVHRPDLDEPMKYANGVLQFEED